MIVMTYSANSQITPRKATDRFLTALVDRIGSMNMICSTILVPILQIWSQTSKSAAFPALTVQERSSRSSLINLVYLLWTCDLMKCGHNIFALVHSYLQPKGGICAARINQAINLLKLKTLTSSERTKNHWIYQEIRTEALVRKIDQWTTFQQFKLRDLRTSSPQK